MRQRNDAQQPLSLPIITDPDGNYSKYIVYVDESGDHGLKTVDEQYPLFVLVFCVFHKNHYSERLVPALQEFKFSYFGHDQVILHENDIRKEKGVFNILRNRAQKNKFLKELSCIIESSNFILISCVIDKRSLDKRVHRESNPYHIAVKLCLETLFEFLREKRQHEKRTHVVVECRGKKEDNALALEFRKVCNGDNRLAMPLPFHILFADKKALSSGLQLADLIARPIGLSVLRPHQENQAFDILKYKFYCAGGPKKAAVGYANLGLKIYPSPESEKPR